MLVASVFVLAGIALLSYAADEFVVGAARIAVKFNVSAVVVGAVIIGFGTSLPEMLVSGVASSQGDPELGIGNVIGSNVANLSLVLGVAALIAAIPVGIATLRRELPLSVGSVIFFALLVQGGLTRTEGLVLAMGLAAIMGYLLMQANTSDVDLSDEMEDIGDPTEILASTEWVRTMLGLIGTVVGAWLLVEGATTLADKFGLSGGFVGLTLVAIGTSLPELVTAVAAVRKGHTDLIVGNLLGSNIFNSLAVGAVVGITGPKQVDDAALTGTAVLIMIGVAVFAGLFMVTDRKVVRWEAAALLVGYLVAMPFTMSEDEVCDDEPVAVECVDEAALIGSGDPVLGVGD